MSIQGSQQSLEENSFSEKIDRINWGALFFPAIWTVRYRAWKWASLFVSLMAILFIVSLLTSLVGGNQGEIIDAYFAEQDVLWETHEGEQEINWEMFGADQEAELNALLADGYTLWLALDTARIFIAATYFIASIVFAMRANRIVWKIKQKSGQTSQFFIENQKLWVGGWVAWHIALNLMPSTFPGWAFDLLSNLSATPGSVTNLYWIIHSYVVWHVPAGFEAWPLRTFPWDALLVIAYSSYLVLFLQDRLRSRGRR